MDIRNKILEEVKNGKSYYSLSKKYNISVTTISTWCKNVGIKSKHKPLPKKADDEKIIQTIKQNLAMTRSELEKKLGYSSLQHRLRKLIKNGNIKYIRIPGKGHTPSLRLFPEYTNRKIFYVDKKDLEKWIKKQLPKTMPQNLRKAISHKLKNLGINIENKKEKTATSVTIDKKLYKKIMRDAQKQNKTIKEIVENIIKEYYKGR